MNNDLMIQRFGLTGMLGTGNWGFAGGYLVSVHGCLFGDSVESCSSFFVCDVLQIDYIGVFRLIKFQEARYKTSKPM